MKMWYVYILQNKSKDFTYTGCTGNLPKRVAEHTGGLVQVTKAYLPLQLVAYIAVSSKEKAYALEKYFKTGSGKAILNKRILGKTK